MMNFPEKTLADKPATAINRWLLLLLILAVILTLWMMLREDNTDNTIEEIGRAHV